MVLAVALCFPAANCAADSVALPNGTKLKSVDFERHIAPLFGKLGCNSGSCHGSFRGRGGFRLSLFGYSPTNDYRALTSGDDPRVDVRNPDKSLLLNKPTSDVLHEGGLRFARTSWQAKLIRKWIVGGAVHKAGSGTVRQLIIRTDRKSLAAGERVSATVIAGFSDGSQVDVTPFSTFRVQDDRVATVSAAGMVQARRPGDTALIASYRGSFATARIAVPVPKSQQLPWPRLPRKNTIDHEVFKKLKLLGMTPAGLCSDTDFLRRATLDTIGRLPTPVEIRRFLADPRKDKRRRAIERLLADPMHAALWATRLSDITGNDIDILPGTADQKPRRAKMWHDWLRKRIAENRPYDEIVRGILTATSREGKNVRSWIDRQAGLIRKSRTTFDTGYARRNTLDLFWNRPSEQIAEISAAAFLGVRIECAKCHKHPFDRWTQTDYRAFVNLFAKVKTGLSPQLRAGLADVLQARRELRATGKPVPPSIPRLWETYLDDVANWQLHPETKTKLKPKALAGPEFPFHGDPRTAFATWLTRNDNPFFARNFVNRVWAHYFGTGLVNAVDRFSVVNPPSNEKLLDRLAKDFVASGFDLRRLERRILNSSTYQLAATPNGSNRFDRRNFSRAYVRVLPAETAIDVIQQAIGKRFDFGSDVPAGSRAIEVAPNRLRAPATAEIFRIFDRPQRKTVCDCERQSDPDLRQLLFLMTSPRVLGAADSGRLKTLLAGKKTNDEVVDELYLSTLSRFPTKAERNVIRRHLDERKDRKEAFRDLFWSLLNTREFLTNH